MADFLFTWRNAVASTDGPPSTTRHVLLTLSLHMDMKGTGAFPSTRTLAERTGLSERAVCTHLEKAESLGWVERERNRGRGQAWALTSYTARLPKALNEVQDVGAEGTEPDSAPSPEGTERRSEKALNLVQSNSSHNSVGAAVLAFCEATTGSPDWPLSSSTLHAWTGQLARDYPGIRLEAEIRKALEWHESKGRRLSAPTVAIRRWLDRAEPTTNGNTGRTMSAAELRAWEEGL